jgi:hypothetical protein
MNPSITSDFAAIGLLSTPKSAHAHWVIGKCDNLERALSLRNCSAFTSHPMRMCGFQGVKEIYCLLKSGVE